MNVHNNARLTPRGREILISRLQRGERPQDPWYYPTWRTSEFEMSAMWGNGGHVPVIAGAWLPPCSPP